VTGDGNDLDDIIEELVTIEERLRDRAYERLRAATKGDEAAARDEKTILKARRAIERAITALRSAGNDGSDPDDFAGFD